MKSPTDILSAICAQCRRNLQIRRSVFTLLSVDRSTARCPNCETDLQLLIDEQDTITTEPMAKWLERHGQMALPFRKRKEKTMPVISFRVTATERCLTDIANGTGTTKWYDRIVSRHHISPQLAKKLAAEGLIKVRWWPKGAPLKSLLGIQRCRRVGSARLTSKGHEWLEGKSVAPIIHKMVETFAHPETAGDVE